MVTEIFEGNEVGQGNDIGNQNRKEGSYWSGKNSQSPEPGENHAAAGKPVACSAPHPEKPLAKEAVFSRITWSGKLPRFRNKEDVLVIWGKSSFRGVAQTAGRLND